jgi:hypothetical protein
MKIEKVKLDELKAVDKFLLSFPLRPERYGELREMLPAFPLLIINGAEEIVFGIDYYHFLNSAGETYTDALRLDISDTNALIQNYNLKEKMTGVNLYEKLVFIKKGVGIERSEIYRKTALDITVSRELTAKLDLLLSTVFRSSLIEEAISLKTGLKLCDFQPGDRETLIELFTTVSFSSSHQLKIVEMAEEILFRDKCALADVFEKLELRQYMEVEKPQKKIIDALFTYRNPVYAAGEATWQDEMKRLNLPGHIKVTHYPYFEKKNLELTIQLKDKEQLKDLIEKLGLPGIPHSGSE